MDVTRVMKSILDTFGMLDCQKVISLMETHQNLLENMIKYKISLDCMHWKEWLFIIRTSYILTLKRTHINTHSTELATCLCEKCWKYNQENNKEMREHLIAINTAVLCSNHLMLIKEFYDGFGSTFLYMRTSNYLPFRIIAEHRSIISINTVNFLITKCVRFLHSKDNIMYVLNCLFREYNSKIRRVVDDEDAKYLLKARFLLAATKITYEDLITAHIDSTRKFSEFYCENCYIFKKPPKFIISKCGHFRRIIKLMLDPMILH